MIIILNEIHSNNHLKLGGHNIMSKKSKKSITKQMKRVDFVNQHKVIVGVDIGSTFHFYQTKKDNSLDTPTPFKNDISGFNSFHEYIKDKLQVEPQNVICPYPFLVDTPNK